MDVLLGFLILVMPPVALVAFTVIMVRRNLRRRARERAQNTYRNPFLLTAFGWVVAIIGGFFLIISLVTAGDRSGAAGGSSPDDGTIAAAVMLLVGAVWAFVYGRRRITIWGERMDYQPFFAARRTLWAMDAVRAETTSNGRVTTYYVKARDGRSASWYREVFPPRTVAAFEHGVHHHAVDADSRRTHLGGMVPFTLDESLEMPDGTVATWRRDRTVQLEVLISTPDDALLRVVENRLTHAFQALPQDPRTDALLGAGGVPNGYEGTVEGARVQWRRRPGKEAIDARILATGENRLDTARRAYRWLGHHLVDARKQQLGSRSRRRGQDEGAFTVTYRETWT